MVDLDNVSKPELFQKLVDSDFLKMKSCASTMFFGAYKDLLELADLGTMVLNQSIKDSIREKKGMFIDDRLTESLNKILIHQDCRDEALTIEWKYGKDFIHNDDREGWKQIIKWLGNGNLERGKNLFVRKLDRFIFTNKEEKYNELFEELKVSDGMALKNEYSLELGVGED